MTLVGGANGVSCSVVEVVMESKVKAGRFQLKRKSLLIDSMPTISLHLGLTTFAPSSEPVPFSRTTIGLVMLSSLTASMMPSETILGETGQ